MKRVDDAPSEQILPGRRRRKHGVPRRLAEEQPEPRPCRSKLTRRRQREIELEQVGQQEHAVGRRPAREIDEVHGVGLVDEHARPVVEHVRDRNLVDHGEGEVEIRVTVASARRERADGRSRDDSLVLVCDPEHALAESIPLLDREHDARV